MSEHTLTITIASEDLDPGQGGAVWVRLEPEAAQNDVATVAQAAAVIDELFRIEPCAGGLGTGGLEVEIGPAGAIEPPVDEPAFDQVTQTTLGVGVCQAAASGWSWEGRVRVLRSHVEYPYVLRLDQGEVIATELIDETVDTALLFDNANTATLDLPVAGPVEGWWGAVVTRSGAAPSWTVSGATINLDRRATGQLNLRYRTVHDLATIRVRGRAGTEQLQQALCLCFYRNLVADCTLEPPAVDDRDLARLQCNSTGRVEDEGGGECYETVTTQTLCSCSGEVWDESTADVTVTCPEGASPGRHFMGSRVVTAGWTMCPGERDDSLFDPDTQRALCCREFTPSWPCVSQTRSLPGGRGIEHGVDHYLGLYGPRTKLVGLTPPEGNCGKLIIEQRRISRNCCDLALPVSLPEELVAAPDSEFTVEASPGVEPYDWQGEGGLILEGTSEGTRRAHFRTADDFCGTGFVTVTDACDTTAVLPVRSTEGMWELQGITDPCMELPGYAPGPADDDGPTDLCGYFSLPMTRTTGEWMVTASLQAIGFSWSCPEIPEGCGRRYITRVRGLGKDPGQASCDHYICYGLITNYGSGCCSMKVSSTSYQHAIFYQTVLSAQKWVCA